MTKQQTTWQLIHKSLRQNQPVMLLYVLESNGSSPGRQGFMMAVNAVGEMAGSIGGGIMEYKFVEMAKEKLNLPPADSELSIKRQYHDKSAARNQSGMICSGDQTILLYQVHQTDSIAIQGIISCLATNQTGLLDLSPAGLQFFSDQLPRTDYHFRMKSEADWQYQEKIGYKNQLFIVGGGHCSLALSELMSRMDFYIRVFDDRSDLHTIIQNHAAHETILVKDYSELAGLISSGQQQYVVVMSMGYRTDELAIKALVGKDFRYFGVLGSKTKIGKLFDGFRADGISEQALSQIHAPIGLAINSQTPEEIAVSIASEIIKVKNKN